MSSSILKTVIHIVVFAAATLTLSNCSRSDAESEPQRFAHQAPEFVGLDGWLNSAPLKMSALRGKVVLVEFWTHGCINCIRVLPHVSRWHQSYKDRGLVIVGVHTPESSAENSRASIQAAIERFGIQYPVALDSASKTWDAFGNRYWPALYLIDRNGFIVMKHYGEGDYEQTEARIRALLGDR